MCPRTKICTWHAKLEHDFGALSRPRSSRECERRDTPSWASDGTSPRIRRVPLGQGVEHILRGEGDQKSIKVIQNVAPYAWSWAIPAECLMNQRILSMISSNLYQHHFGHPWWLSNQPQLGQLWTETSLARRTTSLRRCHSGGCPLMIRSNPPWVAGSHRRVLCWAKGSFMAESW